jgi:mono/diheme cytochrome c family protein
MRATNYWAAAAFGAVGLIIAGYAQQPAAGPAAPAAATFLTSVTPVLNTSCVMCHNEANAAGGLNIKPFLDPATVTSQREEWDKIVQKIRTAEMPPPGIKRPDPAKVEALLSYLGAEFEKADRALTPDPGRVTARRLNRAEYSNTIRDLLGVDFRAEKDFPTDDSGYGFDNIGDVLTISPVLMEKYITAAERISSRALGADPLPKKPLEFEYHTKDKTVRRVNVSNIEATHRVEWDAEYDVRIGLPGERAADAKPVTMGFWMDGKLIHTMPVETKPSGLVYFNPYSEETFRIFLPAGDHVFRAGFINDEYVKTLPEKDRFSDKKNKFLNMIKFIGPYPAQKEPESRKKILVCDPNTGTACVNKILASLARRAWRRPVTPAEVAKLAKFVALGKAEGLTTEQGLQVAIQAVLVSPHFLFRIERDPDPTDATKIHPVSDLELASRLSYFLWSSMPDEELLSLAEAKKLRGPGVLPAQVKRMLADPKAGALAENFAGQWLEIRNLDSVKPDPVKFPEWNASLKEAMREETRMFFASLLKENRPVTEFLNAGYTFLNDRLASHYGIDGVEGPEFRRVDLSTPQRGGILSHASVLTVSSYPTRTSPVIRGKYVLENILGTPPPPPPPDVPALDEQQVGNAGSLRQQLEKHRSNAVCASCHNRMDVLGFGLENYDAVGKWRTKDGKFDIDAGGTLPGGKSFQTPAELRALLSEDVTEFSRCLTEKMLTYALGRGLERRDRIVINNITKALADDGYKFQTLINEIVRSLPFQSRRGEAIRSETATKPRQVAQR